MRFCAPLVLVALAPAVAAAQPKSDGRQLIDESAGIVLRGESEELEKLAALARSLGGEVSQVVNLASIGSAGALGFDLLSRAGWPVAGLDPARPFFVQVSLSAGGLRHARAVAAIGDAGAVTAWSRRIPALDRAWTASDDKGDLGALLGIKGGGAAAVGGQLRARKIEVVGWSSVLKVYAFVHREAGFLVIDLFIARGRAIDWSRDAAQVLARLDKPRKSVLSRHGVADKLGARGVWLWARPGAVFDLLADPSERACGDLATASRPSGLLDLVFNVRRGRSDLDIGVAYGLADGSQLVPALAIVDDRLASTVRADAVLAATLYTGSLEKLRDLPRDSAIRAGWSPLWRRVRDCGKAIRAELELFAWPELFGQWLDEAARLSPGAAALVASVRNLGIAARSLSLADIRESIAFAEVSLVARARPAAEAVLDAVFGARHPGRRHTSWGSGRLRPYLIESRALSTVGAAFGEGSLKWRLRRYRAGGPGKLLGSLGADGGAVLRQIAPDLPERLAAVGKAAAGRVGSVSGELLLSRSVLALSVSIKIR